VAVKIVDASAIAALLFGEPAAEEIAQQLEGHALVAPTLLPLELASVCVKKIRRHPSQRTVLLEALPLFERLPLTLHSVEWRDALHLAEQYRLTVYDACYLQLAHVFDAALVTLDHALRRAATSR